MGAEQSVPSSAAPEAQGGGAGPAPPPGSPKPAALVVVGPSGVGKGTLIAK